MKTEILKEKIIKQGGRVFERNKSKIANTSEKAFAICVKTDDEKSLSPMKVYEVTLSKTDYVGVIDEHGEKAIYPADFFIYLDLSPVISRTLRKAVALS